MPRSRTAPCRHDPQAPRAGLGHCSCRLAMQARRAAADCARTGWPAGAGPRAGAHRGRSSRIICSASASPPRWAHMCAPAVTAAARSRRIFNSRSASFGIDHPVRHASLPSRNNRSLCSREKSRAKSRTKTSFQYSPAKSSARAETALALRCLDQLVQNLMRIKANNLGELK